MKKQIALGCVLALGLPGVAAAAEEPAPAKQNAAQACKAERDAMGAETFGTTYGTNANKKNAFGKCVSKRAKEARAATKSAKKECKAAAKAKTDKAERKAAKKACVEKEVDAEMAAKTEARTSAAKTCREEQTADPAAFSEKYGTGKKKRNAFGKCVSSTAKQQEAETGEES